MRSRESVRGLGNFVIGFVLVTVLLGMMACSLGRRHREQRLPRPSILENEWRASPQTYASDAVIWARILP